MKNHKSLLEIINRAAIRCITVPWCLVMAYLLLLSWFSTSVLAYRNDQGLPGSENWREWNFFIEDRPWKHILILLLLTCLLLLYRNLSKRYKKKINMKICNPVSLSLGFFVLSVIFILLTGLYPKSDPAKLVRIAQEFLNGDFHQFEVGGYMHRCPYQSGFLLYICIMLQLFGRQFNIGMQMVNAILMVVAFIYMNKAVSVMWKEEKRRMSYLTAMVLFLPLMFFVTYIYGNMIGLACFAMAIYHELIFFNDRKWSHIIYSSLLSSLGLAMKENYLVIFVAMLAVLGFDLILTSKKGTTLLFVGTMIVFWIIGGKTVNMVMESYLGAPLPVGIPRAAWIAMGLQEGSMAPGTYNGTNVDLFRGNHYDYRATDEAAKDEIKESLQQYVQDWRQGAEFFGRKQAALWNEPSFHCFSILRGREGTGKMPPLIKSMIDGKMSIYLMELFNIGQSILLFGICVYIILCKEKSIYEFIFAIIFMGTFILHTFWEANSYYVLVYFWMMIPYAVRGYREWLERISNGIGKVREGIVSPERRLIFRGVVLIGAVCVIILAGRHILAMKTFHYFIGITSDEERITAYEQQIDYIIETGKTFEDMKSGR